VTPPAPQLFGTDGIRGPFGEFPLDQTTITRLGYHLGRMLDAEEGGTGEATDASRPQIVLAGDTRESTPALASWFIAGFRAAGGGGHYAGVLPTPGIAYLTRSLGLDGGVAVSASHNPFLDNGIKLFDRQGFKWDRGEEHRLEMALLNGNEPDIPEETIEAEADPALAESYLQHLKEALPSDLPLSGLNIALDTANGAAAPYAERLFESLGARVTMIGNAPNGRNINLECGSTHPNDLCEMVATGGYDLGIAFDGDADRALLVDEKGVLQDGDTMLYLWALHLQRSGDLSPSTIVATTMSNLGLEVALKRHGIETVRCDVGDRIVVETMRRERILLGGEQSGHVVHLDLGSTGDGLMSAIQLAQLVAVAQSPLSQLAADLERFPQVLVNVHVSRRVDFSELPSVVAKARLIEKHLGDEGRLLLRYSGTEPLARVMIEGRDQQEIEALAADLANEIGEQLGAG
jgi:phosphoglucosamine mutase